MKDVIAKKELWRPSNAHLEHFAIRLELDRYMNVWIVDHGIIVVHMDLKNPLINAKKGTTVLKEVKQMYQLRLIIDVLLVIIALKGVPLLCHVHQVTSYLLGTFKVAPFNDPGKI